VEGSTLSGAEVGVVVPPTLDQATLDGTVVAASSVAFDLHNRDVTA
jgi:hypothetical protein